MCSAISSLFIIFCRDVLESPVKLSDFFFPDALLGALHQETARIEKCSMNDLTLSCSFKENRSSISSASVCIESVVLQGAVLNTNNLSSVDASSPQFSEIPPIIVSFNRDSEPNLDVGEKLVVPVLLFPWKNQVIMEVPLPCANEHDKMKWILCGVKLFVGA